MSFLSSANCLSSNTPSWEHQYWTYYRNWHSTWSGPTHSNWCCGSPRWHLLQHWSTGMSIQQILWWSWRMQTASRLLTLWIRITSLAISDRWSSTLRKAPLPNSTLILTSGSSDRSWKLCGNSNTIMRVPKETSGYSATTKIMNISECLQCTPVLCTFVSSLL